MISDSGMMLKIKLQTEFAHTMADNSDPNLTIAEGLPYLGFIDVRICLVETGNDLGLLSESENGRSGGHSGRGTGKK